jgi:uncharacterized protein YdiU (UPF0061 family)
MSVGFIHGVMNTDNMQVAGESIDFGPCAFMDRFHPQKVFSSIDHYGRYAWDKQPSIALWNLTRLAESLLPLINADQEAAIESAKAMLSTFMPAFEKHFEDAMRAKLGWRGAEDTDGEQIAAVFTHMMTGEVDFTLFFRRLTELAAGADETAFCALFNTAENADKALSHWRQRAGQQADVEAMRRTNPIYIARNHRVEEAIQAANASDISKAERLIAALQNPFEVNASFADLELPPTEEEVVQQTFCGT